MDILTDIKILLGITDACQDTLLYTLIRKCTTDITTFCNDEFLNKFNETELPKGLVSVLIDYVILQYRRLGAEGKQSESMGDYSATYYVMGDDIPQSIKTRMYAYRKMRIY